MQQSYHVVPLAEVFRNLRENRVPLRRTVAITFDDCYADNLPAAEILHQHGLPATFFVPTDYVNTDAAFPWDGHLPRMSNLSWADLRHMTELGHDIGSHTASHPDMSRLTLAQAREELLSSRKAIEDRLGRPVRHFAYPFGGAANFRAEQLPLVAETGYEGCLSALPGFIEPGMAGGILPRAAVPKYRNLTHLEMHINRCLDWLYGLKRCIGTA